ncbi:MAG: dihydrofolate reductase [Bacteroidetes bacterium]|nr:MAG: dihydrofolate reductase [Bacteroidota bacterium]
MGKIILHIATSIDGFIADEQGGVSWLDDYMKDGEDYGMGAFFKSVDKCIMGSKSYEFMLSFNYWYPDMAGYIFTTRNLKKMEGAEINFCQGDPARLVEKLRSNKKDIWLVGGTSLITPFINENLLDEMVITIVPKILGKGLPLFQNIDKQKVPTLIASKAYPDGVVQVSYQF